MTTEEIFQSMQLPGTNTKPMPAPTVASATSIDLSASAVAGAPIVKISGTTDIANIKPPFEGFQGPMNFLFPDATPPDFVSGGTPATGYFAIALTKSMVRYEVVTLWLVGDTWYPSMS